MRQRGLLALGIVAASIPGWAQSKSGSIAIQTKSVNITAYQNSTIDAELAKKIVRGGSDRLFDNNAQVPCGQSLAAVTPLIVLSTEPSNVLSSHDYAQVCAVHADIHIVKSIAFCSSQYADADDSNVFYGCSKVGCGMVTDMSSPTQDVELAESQWMHEYGHTQGLPDRSGDKLLMNPFLFPDQFEVSTYECNQIKSENPPPQAAMAPAHKVDVNTFVRQIYMHGVPLDQARAYTPEEVAQVAGLLASCKAPNSDVCSNTPSGRQVEAGLPNIVLLIGVAGDAKTALQSLVAFLQRPAVDSRWFYQARLAVPLAVGYLLRRNPEDELALHFLQDNANLNVWRNRGLKLAPAESVETTAIAMTQYSILGLGLSRHPQALLFLKQLAEENNRDLFYQTQSSKDLINHAIKVNQSK